MEGGASGGEGPANECQCLAGDTTLLDVSVLSVEGEDDHGLPCAWLKLRIVAVASHASTIIATCNIQERRAVDIWCIDRGGCVVSGGKYGCSLR